MHRNDCSGMWKVELVCAQIDHRSLFLLKTQWQQCRDVLLYHSVLQHSRESVNHSGHHHRPCGMCCASHPFRGHHLAVNSHTTKTNTAQLLLPLDTCSFSNQRLSCSTVHYQVSRRDSRGSRCPCRVLVVLATPGAVPSLLCCFFGHSAFQSLFFLQRKHLFSLRSRARRSFGVPSPSMGFEDRRVDCRSCREPFARYRTAVRDEQNPRSFRAAFLSSWA